MDRNNENFVKELPKGVVATREGGVDRNSHLVIFNLLCLVATREGGVDRNCGVGLLVQIYHQSPPARVAWIETPKHQRRSYLLSLSPPARVAWIETFNNFLVLRRMVVATPEGGVDRNILPVLGN